MVRIKQFADDLAISTKQAKDLINKGRNRKDGGSQILESVMSDTDKKKNKKKKTKKLKPQLMPRIGGRGRYKSDDESPIMPRIEGRGRYTPDDKPQIMPRNIGRTPNFSLEDLKEMGIDPRTMSNGGSNVTKINKDKLSKAQMGQFRNIQSDAVKGKITSAEAEKMIRKLVLNKKAGGATDFGMLSVKAGIDKNPSPTKADRIAGATMKEKTVNKAKGGGIAIQGLGFKGVK